MDKKTNIQQNRIHHLEDTMIIYCVYNSDTLTDLIDTVHRMQNFTTWNEKTFAGKLHDWMEIYSQDKDVRNYAIFKSNMNLIKRLFTHFFTTTIKIGENSERSESSICKIHQRL